MPNQARRSLATARRGAGTDPIEVGYQVFTSDGGEELGAVRGVDADGLVVYGKTPVISRTAGGGRGGALSEGDPHCCRAAACAGQSATRTMPKYAVHESLYCAV
jgi:hypothetical protein